MIRERYDQLLAKFCEVVYDTAKILDPRGKSSKGHFEHTPPEGGGYPVVLAYLPQTTFCSWCEEEAICPNEKIISRSPGSQLWEGKCKDCGKRVSNPFVGKDL